MISVEWYDSRRQILLLRYPSQWDTAAMHQAYDKTFRLLAEVNHPVISIVDMREAYGIPKDSMMVVARRERCRPDHFVGAVLVTPLQAANTIIQLWAKMPMVHTSFTATRDLDEALRIVRQRLAEYGVALR